MNSSNKRIEEELNKFDYNKNPLRLTFGVVIVIFLCSFLIVIATFTELSFSSNKLPTEALLHPWAYLTQVDGAVGQFVWGSNHIPQIPVIIFIAALLGSRFGFISVMLYIIAGLTAFPVFATFVAIFIANEVLPIPGRAPTITKSPFPSWISMLSRSEKPVLLPVTAPPFSEVVSISW